MNTVNDNHVLPPVQLLVTTCGTTDNPGMRLAWLHGYCLLTYKPDGAGLRLDGEVRIGESFGENLAMVQALVDALDPTAVLAGFDLTSMISQLGRLPIEANDPAPSLELLAKLKSMLEHRSPIELALTEDSQTEVSVQAFCNRPGSVEDSTDAELGDLLTFGEVNSGHGNFDPHRMAVDLADTAGAYMLALGNIYLADDVRPKLEAALRRWRENFAPHLPPRDADGE